MKTPSKSPRLAPLPVLEHECHAPTLIPVHFEYTHPTAISVAVAGSFNDWHSTTKSMRHSGNGRWSKEAFLSPGRYEYCLVVDGHWMADPLSTDCIANPFGGTNSLLHVVAALKKAVRAPKQKLLLNKLNQQTLQS